MIRVQQNIEEKYYVRQNNKLYVEELNKRALETYQINY